MSKANTHHNEVAAHTDAAVEAAENDRFPNPGLPPHQLRRTDTDPKVAKRAERQVVLLFALSILGTVGMIVAYFMFKPEHGGLEATHWSTLFVGLGMGFSLLGIGLGAVHWAKTLMSDHEQVEERHQLSGTAAERQAAIEVLRQGVKEAGIARRPMILFSLLGAALLAPLGGVVLLRDLGPLANKDLEKTLWRKGIRLARDPGGEPIKAADVTQGSVFHVVPENLAGAKHMLEEKTKAAVLLVRLDPAVVKEDPARKDWSVDGIYAYSKICTHVGCPVALYEQQTHHLLCPCHQSTFDLTDHCKVIFGPAKRALPQLPITVDAQGYLVASDGFQEPVGPSYWERG